MIFATQFFTNSTPGFVALFKENDYEGQQEDDTAYGNMGDQVSKKGIQNRFEAKNQDIQATLLGSGSE